jgi:hypothetical protein
MGDVIVQKARQKRDFKFVFKRKIFLPSHNEPSEDNMFARLVYLQVLFIVCCWSSLFRLRGKEREGGSVER